MKIVKFLKILLALFIIGVVIGMVGGAFSGGKEPVNVQEQVSIPEKEVEEVYTQTISRGEIVIVHDNKRNVTCWCYRGGQRGGISCIPDHMLTL